MVPTTGIDTRSETKQSSAGILKAKSFSQEWRGMYKWWWSAHYLIGCFGVISSVISTMTVKGPIFNEKYDLIIFAGISAFATSMVTFLGPLQRATNYTRAFHDLDHAISEYEDGLISIKKLSLVLRRCREIVQSNMPSFSISSADEWKKDSEV